MRILPFAPRRRWGLRVLSKPQQSEVVFPKRQQIAQQAHPLALSPCMVRCLGCFFFFMLIVQLIPICHVVDGIVQSVKYACAAIRKAAGSQARGSLGYAITHLLFDSPLHVKVR